MPTLCQYPGCSQPAAKAILAMGTASVDYAMRETVLCAQHHQRWTVFRDLIYGPPGARGEVAPTGGRNRGQQTQ